MGFLNNLFGSKESEQYNLDFLLPMKGEVVAIEEVPDPVFSQKMMGDGIAIKPAGGKVQVFSPISGEAVTVFPTKHAVGLKMKNGIEILVHVGLETVALEGEGFTAHIEQGQKVSAGDLMLEVDFDKIGDKIPSSISPIVFTAMDGYGFEATLGNYEAKSKDAIKIVKK